MSVVAVKKYKDKIVIGADSIIVTGDTQEKKKLAKLWRISDDLILGTAGYCSIGGLFKNYLVNHLPKTNDEDGYISLLGEFTEYLGKLKGEQKLEDNNFIIVYKKKAFLICGYYVREIKDYYAIGAGMDYALSALYLKLDVKKAIEVACELSIYCEKPINIITIKK